MNPSWKRVAITLGGLLLFGGLSLLPGCCLLILIARSTAEAQSLGILWLAAMLLTWVGGIALIYHAWRSLKGRPSSPLHLPPLWGMGWGLLLVLIVGTAVRQSFLGGLLFPPLFLLAGALPPLAALTWATHGTSPGLTWRQFAVALICGVTVSVPLAVLLEVLIPVPFIALVSGLFEVVQETWSVMLDTLTDGKIAQVLSSRRFLIPLIQFAVVAPLAEEFVKPLAVLPMIRQARGHRQAFLIGATAGVGFAILENLLYTGGGISIWGGVVVVRTLGAAIHPLGTGLVAVGWHELFHPHREQEIPRHWLSRFGLAVGLHALWNGGSLLLLALISGEFFGPSPPEVDVLGMTLAGVLLAMLATGGGAAWVGMRAILRSLDEAEEEPLIPSLLATDRTMALWAVLCLIAALTIGLSTLWVLGGGG